MNSAKRGLPPLGKHLPSPNIAGLKHIPDRKTQWNSVSASSHPRENFYSLVNRAVHWRAWFFFFLVTEYGICVAV